MVFDNTSDSRIFEVCQKQNIKYFRAPAELDRFNSWLECFKIASSLGYAWVKPLFMGDTLNHDALDEIDSKYDFYIFRYTVTGRLIRRINRRPIDLGSMDANLAVNGPWSGPPLAVAFKSELFLRYGILKVPLFGEWTADFSLFYGMLSNSQYLLSNANIGNFTITNRKTFLKKRWNSNSFDEEMDWIYFALQNIGLRDDLKRCTYLRVIILGLRRFKLLNLVRHLRTLRALN
jgi:hypothetical protein